MKKFKLDIYTPYGHYLSEEVEYLSVSSEQYKLGIYAGHAELISTVVICEIEIEKDGVRTHYATSGGVIKIKDNQVDLILKTIESADEIDLESYTLGILADHAPLVSTVVICEIIIEKDDKREIYATSGGIIKVENNQVDLILETIESADEIDLERAQAAKERAERRLADSTLETLAQTRARLALARAENRINIKNKK